MSNLTLSANPLGTGTFIVQSPNSNTNNTLTLPDATTTLVVLQILRLWLKHKQVLVTPS